MNYLSYERLTKITETQKPYRRTTNRYPLSYREHGYKCFFVEKDAQGNIEYHIAYQHAHTEKELTKSEADAITATGGWVGTTQRSNGTIKYYVWERHWHMLGIVRNDNTFEFTTSNLHQGDRMFLSATMGKHGSEVVSSVKHGGAIYREYIRDDEKTIAKREDNRWSPTYYIDTKIIPLFKGQRINLESNESVINYEVHLPYVNRKRSKEVVSKYKDEIQVAETFFKTMTSEVFASEMQEVYNKVFADDEDKPSWRSHAAETTMLKYAKSRLQEDLYEGLYALMMGLGVLNSWAIGCGNQYYRDRGHFPLTYFQIAYQKFIKYIKLENGALDVKVYSSNELYPSNAWEVKILVDGNEVRAY